MRTTRLVFFVGVLLAASLFGFYGALAQQVSQVPQSEAQVLITIASKGGSPFSAPTKSNFVVRDNGHSVEANELRSVKDDPLIFSLLVDASGSMRDIRLSQTEGAIRLLNALSKQSNRGYLILVRDRIASNDQFVDAQSAQQILRREDSRQGPTALYDAIVHAATKQLTLATNFPSARRAIFLLSDGGDNVSHISLEDTLTLLQQDGIPVFCVNTPSTVPDKRGLANLRALSQNTGGAMVSLDGSGDFVSRVLNYIDNQYVLSFSAFPEKHHKLHSVEVKSLSKDFAVSAPAHYLAP
jgi:VWFA-related protein